MNSSKESFDYSNYMTIEALEDNVLVQLPRNSKYGINGIGWKEYNNPLFLKAGQFLSVKDTVAKGENYGTISITGRCNLRGSCMSLIYGDNLNGNNSLLGYDDVFAGLFSYCNKIQEVENNFLPATTLADRCYASMFFSCASLVNAPALPATTLADRCYASMFFSCASLVNAPALPATTLADRCYRSMFEGCSNLNYIKMLATDISASNCLYEWVYGVASSGTFVKNPAMNSLPTGVSGIPSGWTVVNDGEESGGGKIVNHGIITGSSLRPIVQFEYPVTSSLAITLSTSHSSSTQVLVFKGATSTSLGLGPGETIVSVISIEPREDDTYIYELVI